MFEAKLSDGSILKRIVESIKDIVNDVNIDISPSGIALQAMDSSHVALVSLSLSQNGFETYRADQSMVLGVNIGNLNKVMKLADNGDSITLQADNEANHLRVIFENPKTERTTEFNLNLITIDSENLAIPDTEYQALLTIQSGEFSKLCKELYSISETVNLSCNKEFVQFSVEGEVGSGSVKLNNSEGFSSKDSKMKTSESPQ